MPPFTAWFQGAQNIGRLIAAQCPANGPNDMKLVPIEANGQPTSCQHWNVQALPAHLNDFLAALHEAINTGYVELEQARDDGDPVAAVRNRACRLLGGWLNVDGHDLIAIAGRPLTRIHTVPPKT